MLNRTFLFLGQLWQLFEVSQILEFLRYYQSKQGITKGLSFHITVRTTLHYFHGNVVKT